MLFALDRKGDLGSPPRGSLSIRAQGRVEARHVGASHVVFFSPQLDSGVFEGRVLVS